MHFRIANASHCSVVWFNLNACELNRKNCCWINDQLWNYLGEKIALIPFNEGKKPIIFGICHLHRISSSIDQNWWKKQKNGWKWSDVFFLLFSVVCAINSIPANLLCIRLSECKWKIRKTLTCQYFWLKGNINDMHQISSYKNKSVSYWFCVCVCVCGFS